jgi:Putative metal-binding motif/Right handed beta helix region
MATIRLLISLSIQLGLAGCVTKAAIDTSGSAETDTDTDSDTDADVDTGPFDGDGDGYTPADGDCDDDDAQVRPGADEVCDGVDQDCDGLVDDLDDDADGSADCSDDCDPANADVHPAAEELCNGVDDNCDGEVPEDEADDDADGVRGCDGDCDDTDLEAVWGFVELCDGTDNDCDGSVDEDCLTCDLAVPNDVPSVQGGISAAVTGDTVCVAAGTWYESLDFGGAAITLVGAGGADATIVSGNSSDAVVSFTSGEGAEAVLRGFTLRDGYHGLNIISSSPTLEDMVLTENHAYEGGGAYVEDGDPTFTRVRVVSNGADTPVYDGDTYGYGGGLYLRDSDAILEDVVIEDNDAGWYGGGAYILGGAPVWVHVRVTGNSTHHYDGGGVFAEASAPTLVNVSITGNSTGSPWWGDRESRGGGLFLWDASVELDHVIIAGNEATHGPGGGIYVDAGSSASLNMTVIAGNTALGDGGGVYGELDAVVFAYSDVWSNSPDDFSGVTDPTGSGGNLSVDPSFEDAAWHLAASSALVDAGDPTSTDPDGSAADIGIFGGADADGWDLDGDGWPAWWLPGRYNAATSPDSDCDDDDATVYPGAGC